MNGNLPKICESTYAITLCPKPVYYNNNYNVELINTVSNIRRALKYACKYVLYVELTMEGHVHYHGWFNIIDKVKYYKKTLPTLKRIGFIKIKSNVNEGWRTYCNKDQDNMKVVFTLPVMYTDKSKPLVSKTKMNSILDLDYGIKQYLMTNDN